jgi:hypothetical protein
MSIVVKKDKITTKGSKVKTSDTKLYKPAD